MNFETVALGEVAELARDGVLPNNIKSGTLFVGLENIKKGGGFEGVTTVDVGEIASSKFAFTPKHVLYGKLRPYLAKIALPDFEGVCSTDIIPILPGPKLDRRYLAHYLLTPKMIALASDRAAGANLPRLSPRVLIEFPIPLPPIEEQRRIAAMLDKAEWLRAKRRAALNLLGQLPQATFLEMFGDPATNPKGWPLRKIGDICLVKGGKRLPKGEDYATQPTAFRYIRVTDLRGGMVDESNLVFLKPEVQAKISRYVVNEGDLIISIAGSIGLIAPVSKSLDGANLTENAAKLVPSHKGDYVAPFLAAVLQSEHVQRQISSHIGQVTIGKLALFRIEKLEIGLPPIDLQCEFAERAEAIHRSKVTHQSAVAESDALFASLQESAFGGHA